MLRSTLKLRGIVTIGMLLLALGIFGVGSVYAGHHEVKIGVLHSLSGTMAISETSLKDVVLMAVEEINATGGVMGKQIKPVVVDPASDWPLFRRKSERSDYQRGSGGRVRMLDFREPEVGAPGI